MCPNCNYGHGCYPCSCSRQPSAPRVAGLHEGQAWISPNFDEPMELVTRSEIRDIVREMLEESIVKYAHIWQELAKY